MTTPFRTVYKEPPRAGALTSIAVSFKEPTMSRKSGRRPTGARKRRDARVHVINPNAAGIDVGSELHVVAVPPDRDTEPVRSFGCFTADLNALAEWLKHCGIETVAMESTGVCIGFPCFRSLNPVALRSSWSMPEMSSTSQGAQPMSWIASGFSSFTAMGYFGDRFGPRSAYVYFVPIFANVIRSSNQRLPTSTASRSS